MVLIYDNVQIYSIIILPFIIITITGDNVSPWKILCCSNGDTEYPSTIVVEQNIVWFLSIKEIVWAHWTFAWILT